MKFTALLFSLSAISTTAWASSPNPSNTNIRINNEPHLAISKSRVISSLARAVVEPATNDHAALHHLSNAIRDASTVSTRSKSGKRGMSRRSPAMSAEATNQQRSADRQVRADDKQVKRSSGMRKARPRRTRASVQRQQQQERRSRRTSKV
ncbi:hypothetical protein OPT61_g1781 [Boeremia exigua]|uniref:Uncharacterized protein n=1 Tax=Boeremia exigua TaxID=749465 RepID=A0ACC2INW2_9PLEO|nr:hypothetical protein OPT61_g1781 [Boeremia exigua]